jgi:hypothetical protein
MPGRRAFQLNQDFSRFLTNYSYGQDSQAGFRRAGFTGVRDC